MSEKYQFFNGVKYTRDEKTGYYLNSTSRKRIHRAVWEFYNGEIPKGFHVHNKDGDKSNNSIENLAVLSASDHEKLHNEALSEEEIEKRRNNMNDTARPAAIEWHKSEAGRKWHSEHARKQAEERKPETCVCEQCGKPYSSKSMGEKRFCSNACRSAWRRNAGVDDVEKQCEVCGAAFISNKYSKVKTCSYKCRAALVWRSRRQTA